MTTPQGLAQAVLRVWGRHPRGYGFLAARRDGRWIERDFPIDGDGIEDFFALHSYRRWDLYFCPNAFDRPRRLARYALPTVFAHCDIDAGNPETFDPAPTLLTMTSPGRYQGVWEHGTSVEPKVAEAVSRALARNGDAGGWSITKMLRIPHTLNHKPEYDLPVVTVVRDYDTPIAAWSEATSATIGPESTIRAGEKREPADYDSAVEHFRAALRAHEPLATRQMWLIKRVLKTKDQVKVHGVNRSHILTQIIRRLRDLELTEGDCFALAWQSGWCKFRVDDRSTEDLWHEIDKAFGKAYGK